MQIAMGKQPALLLVGILSVIGVAIWAAATGPASPKATTRVLGMQATAPTAPDCNNGNGNGNGNGNCKKDFAISGSVAGLYPGAVRSMPVTLSNPNNFTIYVTLNPVTVANASNSCTADNLRVSVPSTSTPVPQNSTATVALSVRMRNDPPNACKHATFAITYSGTATK